MKLKVKDANLRVIVGRHAVLCAWPIRNGYLFAGEKEVGVFQRHEFGVFLETLDVALGAVLREQAQVTKGRTLAEIKLGHYTFLVSVPFDWDAGHYLVTIHDTDHNVLFSCHRDTVTVSELYAKANQLRDAQGGNLRYCTVCGHIFHAHTADSDLSRCPYCDTHDAQLRRVATVTDVIAEYAARETAPPVAPLAPVPAVTGGV